MESASGRYLLTRAPANSNRQPGERSARDFCLDHGVSATRINLVQHRVAGLVKRCFASVVLPGGAQYGFALGVMAEASISNHGSVAFRDWFNWATLP